VTLLVESRAATRTSAGCSPRRTRTRGAEEREPLPPALDPALLAELNEGLVCLSGCAAHGLGVRDPNAAAGSRARSGASASTSSCSGRSSAATRAGNARCATSPHARRRDRRDRRRPRARPAPHRLQDVLVAIRCHTSLDGCERERRGNRESVLRARRSCSSASRDDRDAVRAPPSSPSGSSST
jgi:error-prone DNA polymerase